MRNLARNKTDITYRLYTGMTEQQDSDGYYTGEKVPTYEEPVTIKASVSAARGSSDIDMFGINLPYTNTVIVDDIACPITETSRLEIAGKPYAVLLVGRSLNHIIYAVRLLTEPVSPTEPVVSG